MKKISHTDAVYFSIQEDFLEPVFSALIRGWFGNPSLLFHQLLLFIFRIIKFIKTARRTPPAWIRTRDFIFIRKRLVTISDMLLIFTCCPYPPVKFLSAFRTLFHFSLVTFMSALYSLYANNPECISIPWKERMERRYDVMDSVIAAKHTEFSCDVVWDDTELYIQRKVAVRTLAHIILFSQEMKKIIHALQSQIHCQCIKRVFQYP